MNEPNKYNRKKDDCFIFTISKILFSFILLAFITQIKTQAQHSLPVEKISSFTTYDPLLISVYLSSGLLFDVDAIITDSNVLYVSIEHLFKNLEIPCSQKGPGHKLVGSIETESNVYLIDYPAKQITIGSKTFNIGNGLLEDTGILYIESSLLGKLFGLNLTFNHRSLSAKLESNFELPFLKKMRLEKTRKNISKIKGEPQSADTIVTRKYQMFKFGTMDWGFSSFQSVNQPIYNYISLGVGTELLYGQANVTFNYSDQFKYDSRQLQYNWRWVDNDNTLIRQAYLGVFNKHEIALLNSPVIGATVSNSPTTIRKHRGHYTINEYTEPGWTVELYINDVLMDYVTADASGLYVFKVPILYGYTVIKLKFFSSLGEERTEERILNIPFTFIPAKTCEYEFSGGVLQADTDTKYALGDFNYGLSRYATIGGGVEYLSRIPNQPFIPYARLAFQPFSRMVVNLEYAHDVRMKGLLNFYLTQSAFLEFDYEKYKAGQRANSFKALEERKIKLTLPAKINKVSLFTKLNFNHFTYQNFKYRQINLIFSAFYKQFNASSALIMNKVSENREYTTTNLSLSYRFRNGFTIRPVGEYNITLKKAMRYGAVLEKRVRKTHCSISYEKNILSKSDNIFLSIRHDLPFSRNSLSVFYNNNGVSLAESAQGSIAFGGDNNYFKANNNSALGKGGIIFYPFLDLNQNGIQDNGEQRILLYSVKVRGGKAYISEKDSIVRVSDLNAFVYYDVEFSDRDLENIAWRFKYKTYQVLVDPNQYKRVYVPVIAMGEVNGTVYFETDTVMKGLGRVIIQIFDEKGNKVAETYSENDGYYSYLGLKPGNYTVRVDEKQLDNLKYQSKPSLHNSEIKVSVEGDVVKGLDFVLSLK